jgi:type III restriction enzyme
MYILKEFQEEAVKGLLKNTFECLTTPQTQQQILLEAPTGSGKTVMMASYIERLMDELPLQPGLNDNVAFIWFAPNTLHIQSFLSLQKLYADTNTLNCIDLDNLGSDPVLHSKDLLFVNWSSVDSLKKIWRRENETNTNLETLIENTYANSTEIILVIDEAHLSAFSGTQAISVRHLIQAKIEVMVTATPAHRPQRNVYISRQAVIHEQMIKKGVRLNIGLHPEHQNGENVHIHLLRAAFAKKKELEQLYNAELGERLINPLLLIQLPSETAALSEEDKTIRETLESLLHSEFSISTNNGKLAVWLSGERDKDGLEEMNGFQDVLIFKQAIAQGWDCPRAAVLVSYRTVQNQNFGIQTVGRILRMPQQHHYQSDDLNYGYVYTNIQTNQINFVPQDIDYFNMQVAQRQDHRGWYFDQLVSSTIINDRDKIGILSSMFERKLFDVVEKKYGLVQLPEVDFFSEKDNQELKQKIAFNRQRLEQNGWQFDIDDHQISIPKDIEVDTYEVSSILLSSKEQYKFAITIAEFHTLFDRFCYDNITRLNRSKSWKKLRETLYHFGEYYLAMFENEAIKLFLFPYNKALMIEVIATALEHFEAWQTEKGNEKRRIETATWEVPQVRYYNNLYHRQEIESHALEPFFEYRNASTPEKAFKDLLKHNEQHIDWWYKNGDQGKEHFAIEYQNQQKETRLFYVDFVIKFKSGKIGLFDTKTIRSDSEAPNKHNALIEYMGKENAKNKDRIFVGGVILPIEVNGVLTWRYCRNKIEDTKDLTGWDFFNPATMNG